MMRIACLLLLLAGLLGAEERRFETEDGGRLAYLDLAPAAAAADDPQRLLLLLPPGPGDERMARSARRTLGNGFARRGFRVIIPVAGDGRSFWSGNEAAVLELLASLRSRDDVADDPVPIAGISNGAISAFHVAAHDPDSFSALVLLPAAFLPQTKLRRLRGKPVYFRVGADDQLEWGKNFPEMVKRLERAGVDLDAELLDGVDHSVPPNWQEIEAFLREKLGDAAPAGLQTEERER